MRTLRNYSRAVLFSCEAKLQEIDISEIVVSLFYRHRAKYSAELDKIKQDALELFQHLLKTRLKTLDLQLKDHAARLEANFRRIEDLAAETMAQQQKTQSFVEQINTEYYRFEAEIDALNHLAQNPFTLEFDYSFREQARSILKIASFREASPPRLTLKKVGQCYEYVRWSENGADEKDHKEDASQKTRQQSATDSRPLMAEERLKRPQDE